MARALDERDEAMRRRSRELAEQAIEQGDAWVRRLGMPPLDPGARQQWVEAISTLAAYRDRWNVGSDDRPLGFERVAAVTEEAGDLNRAQVALQRAIKLGVEPRSHRAATHQNVGIGTTSERSLEL